MISWIPTKGIEGLEVLFVIGVTQAIVCGAVSRRAKLEIVGIVDLIGDDEEIVTIRRGRAEHLGSARHGVQKQEMLPSLMSLAFSAPFGSCLRSDPYSPPAGGWRIR